MSDLKRNNLDNHYPLSSAAYIQSCLVAGMEFGNYSNAVDEKKPLFVSVGYATCHWCHVMAAEAFSDIDTANFLNSHFICIKVDREQRPT